jgi:hypothetical protein
LAKLALTADERLPRRESIFCQLLLLYGLIGSWWARVRSHGGVAHCRRLG